MRYCAMRASYPMLLFPSPPGPPSPPDCALLDKLARMLRGMTRITVTMDDRLAEAVRATAGDNVSGWLAKLVRAELLRRAVAAEIACDQQHPDYLAWRAERLEETDGAKA